MHDFDEVDELIAEEDWEAVLEWAAAHHDTDDPEVAAKVMDSYRLCIAQGMPNASLNLGTFYYNGVFVDRDYKKAYELYKVAADAGNLRAICNCGYCFYYGRHQERDYAKAFEFFNLGALLHGDSNCLYKLGDMYLNGYGVEKNEKYAFMLYERSYDALMHQADDRPLPDVCFRLGKCHLRGIGTDVDPEEALREFSRALGGFYERRRIDPYVAKLIASTKAFIQEAEEMLDAELITARGF